MPSRFCPVLTLVLINIQNRIFISLVRFYFIFKNCCAISQQILFKLTSFFFILSLRGCHPLITSRIASKNTYSNHHTFQLSSPFNFLINVTLLPVFFEFQLECQFEIKEELFVTKRFNPNRKMRLKSCYTLFAVGKIIGHSQMDRILSRGEAAAGK